MIFTLCYLSNSFSTTFMQLFLIILDGVNGQNYGWILFKFIHCCCLDFSWRRWVNKIIFQSYYFVLTCLFYFHYFILYWCIDSLIITLCYCVLQFFYYYELLTHNNITIQLNTTFINTCICICMYIIIYVWMYNTCKIYIWRLQFTIFDNIAKEDIFLPILRMPLFHVFLDHTTRGKLWDDGFHCVFHVRDPLVRNLFRVAVVIQRDDLMFQRVI